MQQRIVLSISLLTLMVVGAGGPVRGQTKSDAWIVQASDPHLLVNSKDTDPTVVKQRELNRVGVANLLKWTAQLPSTERSVRLLVLTGDFDVDPCWWSPTTAPIDDCIKNIPAASKTWIVTRIADLLAESPVQDVYLVPGNNDIARESTSDAAIKYFNDVMADVQTQITSKGRSIRLHNFGRCFAGGDDAQCYADVEGTAYRLVAFPSYSFKNRELNDSYTTNSLIQDQQIARFAQLVDQGRTAGKKLIVVTHTPEIDDPFTLAQDRYAGITPQRQAPAIAGQSTSSTWSVSKAALDQWRGVLALDAVAGVVAGHLHDSHKEIYRQPYSWSPQNEYRDYRKLFLTPPLAVKLQDSSPIQARGASLLHLLPDRLERQLYWYDDPTGTFVSDDVVAPSGTSRHPRRIAELTRSFWTVASPDASLDRWSVLFIALLAAYLTVVRIWQIPPPEKAPGTEAKGDATAATEPKFEPSPFAGNFGQTIVAGLAGLAADAVLKSLEGKPAGIDKEFYVVWFVALFLMMLFGFAAVRAVVEAGRARLLFIHFSYVRPPVGDESLSTLRRVLRWLRDVWERWVHWLHSWSVPLLTLFDTMINLIQGKNQTVTRVFGQAIAEQHDNLLRIADVTRTRLTEVIEAALVKLDHDEPKGGRVRISISALSADQSKVFYISRAPGSAIRYFPRRSVAWISVFTGKIRWYKKDYLYDTNEGKKDEKIVLFDNSGGLINDEAHEPLLLHSFFQQRDQDYEGFIVFPLPWPQRGFASDYVKGAIHVSFRHIRDFENLWSVKSDPSAVNEVDSVLKEPYVYTHEERMLTDEWCRDPTVPTALRDAIAVLGELLKGFNENLYLNRGRV